MQDCARPYELSVIVAELYLLTAGPSHATGKSTSDIGWTWQDAVIWGVESVGRLTMWH